MATFFNNYIDITPPAITGWQTMDLSAFLPANAVAIIRHDGGTSPGLAMGARKVGSADNRFGSLATQVQIGIYCGVNADCKLDLYRSDAGAKYWLTGYLASEEAVYFATGIDKTPAGTGWQDIDCSANVPVGTAFAIFEVNEVGNAVGVNFRNNGSTDAWAANYNNSHFWAVVGVDVNRICEIYTESVLANKIFLVGYISGGAGLSKVNALDKSLGTPDVYLDINVLGDAPANAVAVVVQEYYPGGTGGQNYDLGGKNVTSELYKISYWQAPNFHIVGLNAGKIFSGKVAYIEEKIYVLGYITSVAPPTADFSGTPLFGNAPLTVNFTDLSTGNPTYWEWDFGDGSPKSYVQNPTHIYTAFGEYTVKLTVSNSGGYDDETKVDYIATYNVGVASVTLPRLDLLAGSCGIIATLPLLQVAGNGFWTDYAKMTLPMLEVEGYSSRISNDLSVSLPFLQINAEGIAGNVGQAILSLPTLILSASTPVLTEAFLTLPSLAILAEGFSFNTGWIEATIPRLVVSGSGIVGNVGKAKLLLGKYRLVSQGLTGGIGNASLIIPKLKVKGEGFISFECVGNAILTLPCLKLEAFANLLLGDNYKVYVMNTRNFGLSEYINYNFNSFCKFGDLYLAASSNGIFLLDGAKDDGVAIDANFISGLSDMGVNKIKRIVDAYINLKTSGDLELRLTTDDGAEKAYALVDAIQTLHTAKLGLGRGKKGKYWKFKVLNKLGSDFEVDNIEFNVEALSRKK